MYSKQYFNPPVYFPAALWYNTDEAPCNLAIAPSDTSENSA